MEKYYETNLNYYIKIKLTEEGRIIYKKHYAKYNCEAPKLNIDNEGYVRFQIHDFMNIFGERLFMGATLPCETNCKIQVKEQVNEWHYPSKGEYPKDKEYKWCFLHDYLYIAKYDEMFEWWVNREHEKVMCPRAWKEIVLPQEIKEK